MMNNYLFQILSIFTTFVGILILIYFWMPLFIILFSAAFIYVILMLIIAKLTGKSSNINVKVVNIKRTSNKENVDYIDTTTADNKKNN